MRSTLWSRAARPKLNGWTSTPTSTPTLGRSSVIRQTASAPIRRPLTINDVFTLLLTPILATALLADTSWKDKRRKDWAQRIAEIEAETEEIQTRAQRSWLSLQSQSLGLRATRQRRQYTVAASKPQDEDDQERPLENTVYGAQRLPLEEGQDEPEWFELAPHQESRLTADPRNHEGEESPSFEPEAIEASERLRRLLAIKLGLNLSIYLNTGVSPSKLRRELRIPGMSADFRYNPDQSQDLHGLLMQMKDLCTTVGHLKDSLPNGATPVKDETMSSDFQQLQDKICTLSARFQTSSIAMPELVSGFTRAVLRSPVWPTSKAYLAFFRGLSQGSSLDSPCHDLAMQTLVAWEQSRLPIGDHDLFVILSELARRKHVQKFDGLMRDLTMSPSYINAVGQWTWERAGDIQVPVPKSYNPAILTTLIHCALRFDQPHKAEAWSQILRRTWGNLNDQTQKTPMSRLFTNWMRYYEVQGNWRKGVTWLDAAQKWSISVASFDMYSLQRLAVGMLSLSFACGKTKEYEEILSAAIESGIPSMNPKHFLPNSARKAICREWIFLFNQRYRAKRDSRTDQEKVEAFQSKVRVVAQRSVPDKDSADIEWRYEQEHRPTPLKAESKLDKSGPTSTEDVEMWKRAYFRKHDIVKDSMASSEKWRQQCIKQQTELNFLKGQIENQKKLLRNLQTAWRPVALAETEARVAAKALPLAHDQVDNDRSACISTNSTLCSPSEPQPRRHEGTRAVPIANAMPSYQVDDQRPTLALGSTSCSLASFRPDTEGDKLQARLLLA